MISTYACLGRPKEPPTDEDDSVSGLNRVTHTTR